MAVATESFTVQTVIMYLEEIIQMYTNKILKQNIYEINQQIKK